MRKKINIMKETNEIEYMILRNNNMDEWKRFLYEKCGEEQLGRLVVLDGSKVCSELVLAVAVTRGMNEFKSSPNAASNLSLCILNALSCSSSLSTATKVFSWETFSSQDNPVMLLLYCKPISLSNDDFWFKVNNFFSSHSMMIEPISYFESSLERMDFF